MIDQADLFDFLFPIVARLDGDSFHTNQSRSAAAGDKRLAGGAEAAAADVTWAGISHSGLRDAAAAVGALVHIVAVAAIIVRVVMTRRAAGFAHAVLDDNVIVVDAALGFDPIAIVVVVAAVHCGSGKG